MHFDKLISDTGSCNTRSEQLRRTLRFGANCACGECLQTQHQHARLVRRRGCRKRLRIPTIRSNHCYHKPCSLTLGTWLMLLLRSVTCYCQTKTAPQLSSPPRARSLRDALARRHRPHMVNWSQACTAQLNRPLWQLQQANDGGCLFVVSALLCSSAL